MMFKLLYKSAILYCIILSTISFQSFSQKLVKNEYDNFNKSFRMETNEIKGFSKNQYNRMSYYLRSADTLIFLNIGCFDYNKFVVYPTDETTLLLSDSSTIHIYPTSTQSSNYEKIGNMYWEVFSFQYSLNRNDLKTCSEKSIIGIRISYNNKYIDYYLKEKLSEKLKELFSFFSQKQFEKFPYK